MLHDAARAAKPAGGTRTAGYDMSDQRSRFVADMVAQRAVGKRYQQLVLLRPGT